MKNESMFKNLTKRKDVLYMLILGLVVALVWVTISIFTSSTTSNVPTNLQKLTKPLNPVFDKEAMQKLRSRTTYTKEELQSFEVNREIKMPDGTVVSTVRVSPLPTPTISQQTPTSTSSAKPSPSPSL